MSTAVSKASIRQSVWKHMEKNNIADFPRPVYDRVPNFKGAVESARRLASLDIFKEAQVIVVTPDKPQQPVRFNVLNSKKSLLVPTPQLAHGLFNHIKPPSYDDKTLQLCATQEGLRHYSIPVGLDNLIKVDLFVVGSVAVDKKGHRLGKGKGYADIEYAMMKSVGAITDQTIVVATLHDCQVYEELPSSLFTNYDLNVNVIVTPTRVIKIDLQLQQPVGIIWNQLSPQQLNKMPILKLLQKQ